MKDPAIQKVMEAEKVFLADPDCITAYEQHEKYLRDMAAMKEYDEEVGWERGHAAGLMEERVRLVLKCYRESMSAAAIAGCSIWRKQRCKRLSGSTRMRRIRPKAYRILWRCCVGFAVLLFNTVMPDS